METVKNPQVGIIGLGAMGMGMARALLKAGIAVKGYDIDDVRNKRNG